MTIFKTIAYLSLIFLLSACSSYTAQQNVINLEQQNPQFLNSKNNYKQDKIYNKEISINKNIEGKFRFKTEAQSGSGLFSWHLYDSSWILELKTPINTTIANILYGNISDIPENIRSNKKLHLWGNLDLVKQGINIPAPTFSDILQNIYNKEYIENLLKDSEWKITKYDVNDSNLVLEIAKNDSTSLRLFILRD
jgi:hypothetical protein